MRKIINLSILILAVGLPLFNGGKGFGAFCTASLLLCGLSFWLLNRLPKGERVTVTAVPRFNGLVCCFYILVFINLFFTVYLHAAIIEWIRLTSYLILYLLLIFSAGSGRKDFSSLIRSVLSATVIVALVEAMVMIVQSYQHLSPRGTMPNENVAASYLLIGLMTTLSYLFFNAGATRRRKIIGIILSLVLSAALVLSHSRGALIALVAAAGILSKLRFRKWGMIAIFMALLGVLALFPVPVLDVVFKINIPYSYRRLYIWQSAWDIIMNRPWFGWGMGNFGLAFPRFNLPSFDTVLRYGKVTRFAHNEFLQVAAELGLPAMFFYSAIIGYIVKTGRELIRTKNITWIKAAALASLAGIIVHSLFDFNLHLPAITYVAVILGTSLLLETGLAHDRSYALSAPAKKGTSWALIVIMITTLSFLAGHIFQGQAEKREAKKEPLPAVIRAYQQAQLVDPLNSDHHEKLARLYTGQYQRDKNILSGELAVSEYNRASRLNPEKYALYEDLFYLYYALGSPLPNMEQNYVRVMARNPHLVKPTLILAIFHLERRNYLRTIALLSEVIDKEPNYLAAYYYLAVCYESLGDRQSARLKYEIIVQKLAQHLERLTQNNIELQALEVPRVEVFTRLGVLYNIDQQYTQAIAALNQALALDPEHSEALNALAGTYFSQGQYSLALQYTQTALKLDPHNQNIQRNLARCLAAINNQKKK